MRAQGLVLVGQSYYIPNAMRHWDMHKRTTLCAGEHLEEHMVLEEIYEQRERVYMFHRDIQTRENNGVH